MNEFGPFNEPYARDVARRRADLGLRSPVARQPRRRTTRRAVASRLHRIADRLDG
jgi:hypothetical protein